MLQGAWRDSTWGRLGTTAWDLVIVGGGITGTGLLREAARHGLKALLLEQKDFAWGSSSRSSKLVHGGLRYLQRAHIRLTYETVVERERLLRDGGGLVTPLSFLLPTPEGEPLSRPMFGTGLFIYDLMAGRQAHRHFGARDFEAHVPQLGIAKVTGGFEFLDAQADDARLTLRLLFTAVDEGASALNYARVTSLLREGEQVLGVKVTDALTGQSADVRAKAVVNATGPWADQLRADVGGKPRLRPLRGSHLVFKASRFPLALAFSFRHPRDRRPVYAFPWEGVTVLGTTDLDHDAPLDDEPHISEAEVAYLFEAADKWFSRLKLGRADVIATYAGVRPVVGSGAKNPSNESRESAVWNENGLLTLTGGKLTTFRLTAREALGLLAARVPGLTLRDDQEPLFPQGERALTVPLGVSASTWARWMGRYGMRAPDLAARARGNEHHPWPDSPIRLAELRWSAHAEGVVHLEDLLLRRSRLGFTCEGGGREYLPAIRAACQEELGWTDERWAEEEAAYLKLWDESYAPVPPVRA